MDTSPHFYSPAVTKLFSLSPRNVITAYVYLVDQRGQQFTDQYGDITKGLFDNGISMDLFKNTRVWGDSKGAVVSCLGMLAPNPEHASRGGGQQGRFGC